MKELKLNQLNKDQFQPFGDIIDKNQEIPFEINNGNCLRYNNLAKFCLLYTSPSPRDVEECRMPSSA